MEYWVKENSWGMSRDDRITLRSTDNKILTVKIVAGRFVFREQCDEHYSKDYSKEEARQVVEELRAWIESQ